LSVPVPALDFIDSQPGCRLLENRTQGGDWISFGYELMGDVTGVTGVFDRS
jgi:hypothetical protein